MLTDYFLKRKSYFDGNSYNLTTIIYQSIKQMKVRPRFYPLQNLAHTRAKAYQQNGQIKAQITKGQACFF